MENERTEQREETEPVPENTESNSETDNSTIQAFNEEIVKLRQQLEEKDKKHNEEIKAIISQMTNPTANKKSDLEIAVEYATNKVNSTRSRL